MNNKNKKMFLIPGSILTLCSPVITLISCSNNENQKKHQKQNPQLNKANNKIVTDFLRSSKKIKDNNIDKLVIDANMKYDKQFGYLNNPNETDQEAKTERLIRKAYGRPFSFRGWTKELKNYNEKLFPDKPFQTSWRKKEERRMINPYKSTSSVNGSKFSLLDVVNVSTSNTPIAGVNKDENKGFALNWWQYTDVLNSWGGSGGSGILNAPPADWINAAHRNGVPIVGTLFLPPNVFGGKMSETLGLFEKVRGKYIMAKKLVEIAKANNFDGWLLNFETETGSNNPQFKNNFINWLKYLVQESHKEGQIIQFYGSATKSGVPVYSSINDNSIDNIMSGDKIYLDDYLLDYRHSFGVEGNGDSSISDDFNFLKNKNVDEKDIAKLASYGLEMQKNGITTPANKVLKKLYDSSRKLSSKDPDRHKSSLWSYTYRQTVASKGMDETIKFWSSATPNKDVRYEALKSNRQDNKLDSWKSISNLFTEKTTLISRKPFASSFNTGIGDNFYIEGQDTPMTQYEEGWTSLSSQDIMPTFRWWTDTYDSNNKLISGNPEQEYTLNPKKIIPEIKNATSQNSAFFGGNYLTYKGNLESGNSFDNKLYAINYDLKTNDEFSLVFKGKHAPNVVVWDDQGKKTYLKPENSIINKNGWKISSYKIKSDITNSKSFGLSYKNNANRTISLENNLSIGKISFKPNDFSYKKDITEFDKGYTQGIFASKVDGSPKWDSPAYRMGFDDLKNSDDVKFFIYSTKVGNKYVKQGIGGSMGIWINGLDLKDKITIDGSDYFDVKVDFYRDDNTFKNSQYILIKANYKK